MPGWDWTDLIDAEPGGAWRVQAPVEHRAKMNLYTGCDLLNQMNKQTNGKNRMVHFFFYFK